MTDKVIIGSDYIKKRLFILKQLDKPIEYLQYAGYKDQCRSIWASKKGRILYCDYDANRIMSTRLNAGQKSEVYLDQQHGPIKNPSGVCKTGDYVIVANNGNDKLIIFNKAKTVHKIINCVHGQSLQQLQGVTVNHGIVYVCVRSSGLIVEVTIDLLG